MRATLHLGRIYYTTHQKLQQDEGFNGFGGKFKTRFGRALPTSDQNSFDETIKLLVLNKIRVAKQGEKLTTTH